MLITIVAYFLAFIVGPLAAAAAGLVTTFLFAPVVKSGFLVLRYSVDFVSGLAAGFTALSAGFFVFQWIVGEASSLVLPVLLFLAFLINAMRRVLSSSSSIVDSQFMKLVGFYEVRLSRTIGEAIQGTGDLCGILVAAWVLYG